MEEKRKPGQWELWAVALLAVLIVYPLSLGPIYALWVGGTISMDTWRALLRAYEPLFYLDRLCAGGRLIEGYLLMWKALFGY